MFRPNRTADIKPFCTPGIMHCHPLGKHALTYGNFTDVGYWIMLVNCYFCFDKISGERVFFTGEYGIFRPIRNNSVPILFA